MSVKDDWDSTIQVDGIGRLYSGLYYYFLNGHTMAGVIANCPATVSCCLSPIMDYQDLEAETVSYDTERFSDNGISFSSYLWRIRGIKAPIKELAVLDKYPHIERKKGEKHWSNESRLYQYPYMYGMITDYINPPFEIQYHLCELDKIHIKSKSMLSDKLAYSIYVDSYKGDDNGKLEGQINSGVLDVPCGSSAYSQYSATQKSQDMANYKNTLQTLQFNSGRDLFNQRFDATKNFVNGVGGAISSGMRSGFISAFTQGLGVGANAYVDMTNIGYTQQDYAMQQAQAIGLRSAQMKDLKNTPRSMINTGSDVSFSILNGERRIDFYRMCVTNDYLWRLGEFFYRYGYTRNEFLKPNIKSRKYFNYIQTVDCNVIGNTIPKEHLNQIREIFDTGVTFWHFNNRAEMYNYDDENEEVERDSFA